MIYVTGVCSEIQPVYLQPGYTKANPLLIITSGFEKDRLSLLHSLSGSFLPSPGSNKKAAEESESGENAGLYDVAPRMVSVALERCGCARCMLAEKQGLNRRSGSC